MRYIIKIFSFLLLIIFFLGKPSGGYGLNPFTYTNINSINLENGDHLWMPEHYDNLFNKEKIKKITVIKIEDKREEVIKTVIYNNEFITVDYTTTDYSLSTSYEYDSWNRLIKSGFFTFEYQDNNSCKKIERNRYFQGKLQRLERFEITPSGYHITIENVNGDTATYDFILKDKMVKEISSNLWGRPSLWYKFEYENGLIKKIICGATRGQIWTRVITKYDGKNIVSMDFIDHDTKDKVTTWNFYNYDRHGNWTNAEQYSQNVLMNKYSRIIEYID